MNDQPQAESGTATKHLRGRAMKGVDLGAVLGREGRVLLHPSA